MRVCVWGGIYYHMLLGCTTSSSGCELGLDERENEYSNRMSGNPCPPPLHSSGSTSTQVSSSSSFTHPNNSPNNTSTNKHVRHHQSTQYQHHQQANLDQQCGYTHHNGECNSRKHHGNSPKNEGGIHVSSVGISRFGILAGGSIANGFGEGVGTVYGGYGGNGTDIAVEEESEGGIAASGGLFFANATTNAAAAMAMFDADGSGRGVMIVGRGRDGGALDNYGMLITLAHYDDASAA